MGDKVDDLILQMQHLEASAKASGQARVGQFAADRLKTRALKLAATAQTELDQAQRKLDDGEQRMAKARTPGLPPLEAAELLTSGRQLVQENKTAVVKARARLNFALDQMDEADRQAWDALQAEARAETHAALVDELRPGGAISSVAGPAGGAPAAIAGSAAVPGAAVEGAAGAAAPGATPGAPAAPKDPAAIPDSVLLDLVPPPDFDPSKKRG